MSSEIRVVYDCNIFLQFLLSSGGPAARCVQAALSGRVRLLLSDEVVAELLSLPDKPVAARNRIDEPVVHRFVISLLKSSDYIAQVPKRYGHPIDPDDSADVNLALAGGAVIIVSRDRHLLGLADLRKHWADAFRAEFPLLRILTAEQFLQEIDRAIGNESRQ